jgi:hypothetical protein
MRGSVLVLSLKQLTLTVSPIAGLIATDFMADCCFCCLCFLLVVVAFAFGLGNGDLSHPLTGAVHA